MVKWIITQKAFSVGRKMAGLGGFLVLTSPAQRCARACPSLSRSDDGLNGILRQAQLDFHLVNSRVLRLSKKSR